MIVGVLLAAGQSQRFGSQKLLAAYPKRQPIALTSAGILRPAVDAIIAVVNPQNAELIRLFNQNQIPIVECAECRKGIGDSIATGVAKTKEASGWVIALADMPFIKTQTVDAVTDTLKKGALIVAPMHKGRRGHPIGFSSQLYPELVKLTGDKGARSLLQKYMSHVERIECQDGGILIDIDTPTDLETYSKEFVG